MTSVASALALKVGEKVLEKALSSDKSNGQPKKKKKKGAKPKSEVKEIVKEEKALVKPKAQGKKSPVASSIPIPVRIAHKIRATTLSVRTSKYRGQESLRVSGCDLWGLVYTTTGGTYDTTWSMPLTPLAVLNTRLAIEATLWTKFKYHRCELEFVPMLGTSTNGAYMMTGVSDPELEMPGAEGTFEHVQAYMSVPGTTIQPWYMAGRFNMKPPPGDKEYYIQPDEQNESRLTHEGNLRIIQMTSDNPGAVGFLYVHYDLSFYGKVLSINPSNWRSKPVTLTNGPTVDQIGLIDTGVTGVCDWTNNAGESDLTANTLYLCYNNFDRGGYSAMTLYWYKTPATFGSGNSTSWYTQPADADDQTGENRYRGSVFSSKPVPANATLYYVPASDDPFDPTQRHRPVPKHALAPAKSTGMTPLTNRNSSGPSSRRFP